jgi:CrcB protein
MVNIVLPVFVGGALGAMLREFTMLMVPNPVDNFPMDILVANLVAAFMLGLVTALHRRQIVSEGAELLVGSGIAGGLSTFSSFVYGAVVLMSASTASAVVASVYVVISLGQAFADVTRGVQCDGLDRRDQITRPGAAGSGKVRDRCRGHRRRSVAGRPHQIAANGWPAAFRGRVGAARAGLLR